VKGRRRYAREGQRRLGIIRRTSEKRRLGVLRKAMESVEQLVIESKAVAVSSINEKAMERMEEDEGNRLRHRVH